MGQGRRREAPSRRCASSTGCTRRRGCRVVLAGNRALPPRRARRAGPGGEDAWFAGDAEPLAATVTAAYADEGWPDARASISVEETAEGVVLRVIVDEGAPSPGDVHRAISAGGRCTEREVQWLLGRNGLGRNRPVRGDADGAARDAIEARARRKGWYEAQVAIPPRTTPEGATLVVLVDPRALGAILRDGDVPRVREILDVLDLEQGARLTRTFVADAARELTDAARGEGYLEAAITVESEADTGGATLHVRGTSGAPHRLRKGHFVGAPGEAGGAAVGPPLVGALHA